MKDFQMGLTDAEYEMVQFATWTSINGYTRFHKNGLLISFSGWLNTNTNEIINIDELMSIYKKEKGI